MRAPFVVKVTRNPDVKPYISRIQTPSASGAAPQRTAVLLEVSTHATFIALHGLLAVSRHMAGTAAAMTSIHGD